MIRLEQTESDMKRKEDRKWTLSDLYELLCIKLLGLTPPGGAVDFSNDCLYILRVHEDAGRAGAPLRSNPDALMFLLFSCENILQ